jgi:uncharacterized membrane protein YeaQ/YmgE (transglycosylase-associated protein family)
MGIVAWLILGAVAGYLAGLLARRDEGLGVVGHILLGIVGALVGGFLADAALGTSPVTGLDARSVVVATIGAVISVFVWDSMTTAPARPRRRRRTGRGVV